MAEEKAAEAFAQAEKTLKKWLNFGGNKWEDAQELFLSAGNKWKTAKNWKQAGTAFMRAADCAVKLSSQHDAATHLAEAFNCFRKAEMIPEALTCVNQAVEIYIDNGRFPQAAKYEKEVGEMFRAAGRLDEAVQHYKRAGDFFGGEEQRSQENGCLQLIADIYSEQEKYGEAAVLYEQIGKSCAGNASLKFHAKDHFYKAVFCFLAELVDPKKERAGVVDKAQSKFEEYQGRDPHFAGTREYELLEKVIQAAGAGDEEAISAAVREYDSVHHIDEWKTTVLLKIKRSLGNLC